MGGRFSGLPFFLFEQRSERQLQRHLDLSRTADRMAHHAEASRTIVKVITGVRTRGGNPGGRRAGLAARGNPARINAWPWSRRKAVIVLILRDLIARHVEAAGIRQVIYVEGVLQAVAVGKLRLLHQGSIRTLLERLPEDVALPSREGVLIRIRRRHRSVQASSRE